MRALRQTNGVLTSWLCPDNTATFEMSETQEQIFKDISGKEPVKHYANR